MTIELLYILAAVLPLVVLPLVIPRVILMARRKRMTDAPSERKLQKEPVAVMGGMVIVSVICITLIVINLFYDISNLFPIMCVMLIMYTFGMLDDIVGLSWQFKMFLQVFTIVLLFLSGAYGVQSLCGLFGIGNIPYWTSFLLTVFLGLLIINGVNFVDGIDGLASVLGLLVSSVMSYWCLFHGFVGQALISLVMSGTLLAFFAYNVFSKKYKIYMGDSGSLVLGLFVFISADPATYNLLDDSLLVDRYFISFMMALCSVIIFDLVRVALFRVFRGKSPFHPDRTHLHHAYVDMGMSHLLATLSLLFRNLLVLAVWLVTALAEMDVTLQFLVVFFAGLLFIWYPYFRIEYMHTHHADRYDRFVNFITRLSNRLEPFSRIMTRILDGRKVANNFDETV